MKVVTWNVNSIRVRLRRVIAWLSEHQPDVLCMQETKVDDETFPLQDFEAIGYHVAFHGQRAYNGVAIASKLPLEAVARGFTGESDDAQRRLLSARIGDLRLINLYVPNGSPLGSEKFSYKLEWLVRLRQLLDEEYRPSEDVLLCGDFNVAPDDRDVYDPDGWRGHVLFHPDEHRALARLMDWGLVDAFRIHHEEGGVYSWWDYRAGNFRFNKGLRIDHVLVTVPLADRCGSVEVDRQARKVWEGEKPSDHAPVIATFHDEAV